MSKTLALFSGTPAIRFSIGDDKTRLLLLAVPVFVFLLLIPGLLLKRFRLHDQALMLAVWGVSTALYHLFIIASVSDASRWYFVSSVLLLCSVISWAIAEYCLIQVGLRKLIYIPTVIALVFVVMLSHIYRYQLAGDSLHSTCAVFRIMEYCSETLPRESTIAVCDAGHIGYVFNQHVINADGLVNNRNYQKAYLNGSALDTLKLRGATHLMTVFGHQVVECGDNQCCYTLRSPLGSLPANTDTFSLADILIKIPYHSMDTPSGRSEMILWRFN